MRNVKIDSGLAFLVSCLLVSCIDGSPPAYPSPLDAGGQDVAAADTGPVAASCADEFISVTATTGDGGTQNWCSALSADAVAIDVAGCRPMYTTADGVRGPNDVQLGLSGDGGLFSTLGEVRIGVGVQGRGLPCGSADTFCFFRTRGATCRAVVTRAATAGGLGEVELREPCVLTHDVGVPGPEYHLTVTSLRARGTLRLRNELNQPDHDAGPRFLDCGG